jgi:hypothetical protein
MEITTETFIADIPTETAHGAFSGTSWTPERRGESWRNGYAATLASDYEELRDLAEKHGSTDRLQEQFDRYRAGYRKRFLAFLHSNSRCVSSWIAGPSKFPFERMNRRADVAHKRLGEYLEFRERALSAIRRNLRPPTFISSADADALEKLEQKIAGWTKSSQRKRKSSAAKALSAPKSPFKSTPGLPDLTGQP